MGCLFVDRNHKKKFYILGHIGHVKLLLFFRIYSEVDRLHHLHISGLLKGAEDTIPITSLGARTICSAVSVNDQYEISLISQRSLFSANKNAFTFKL